MDKINLAKEFEKCSQRNKKLFRQVLIAAVMSYRLLKYQGLAEGLARWHQRRAQNIENIRRVVGGD